MEITLEDVDRRLLNLERGQHKLEKELEKGLHALKLEIAAVKITTIQWVIGIFVGAIVTIASIIGVYSTVLTLHQ